MSDETPAQPQPEQDAPVRVAIRIESRSGGQRIDQRAIGDWYDKGGRVFIRYLDPSPESGRTVTVVKLERDAVKILRQGDVRSDQTFVRGEKRIGYYETAQGRLELAVTAKAVRHSFADLLDTSRIASKSSDNKATDSNPDSLAKSGARKPVRGTIELRYELEVAGEPAGLYTVKLTIQEEKPT